MDFISNKEKQQREMLQEIGVKSIKELFSSIPKHLLLPQQESDDGLSEYEGIHHLRTLAKKNSFTGLDSYLGGGAYEHHIPAIAPSICSKSEFLTSYTPYQPEASQGLLQAIFEFQSSICALTGMDIANASLYDGASACAEALLMSLRLNKERSRILIASSLNPLYRSVVETYLKSHSLEIIDIPLSPEGTLDKIFFKSHLNDHTAAVLIQSPNFLGLLEDVSLISREAKSFGALSIQCADLIAYGIYLSAAENQVDIAVGDCQSLGLSLNFGGPYAGYIACKQDLVRQLPGRIVGETIDNEGKRGFVLTLQAREQHIRREKATSNICTNQALAALSVLITALWYGKEGLPKLALANYQRTAYLKAGLCKIQGISTFSNEPFFNEFTVKFAKPIVEVQQHFRRHGIEPGINVENYFPSLKNSMLIAVTETKNKKQLDNYIAVAKALMEVS